MAGKQGFSGENDTYTDRNGDVVHGMRETDSRGATRKASSHPTSAACLKCARTTHRDCRGDRCRAREVDGGNRPRRGGLREEFDYQLDRHCSKTKADMERVTDGLITS